MISASKSEKMLAALKDYKKRYINKNLGDLDESGTRIMINTFLNTILGYAELEEIKTEYMIKGTYADYILQINGKRFFLVEVKAYSLVLSDKHLRQAVNYGANEGIEWVLLTNGRQFQLYKVKFEKPISEHLVFEVDFESEEFNFKAVQECLVYLHRDAVIKGSLDHLKSKSSALEPINVANLLFSQKVVDFLRKELKNQYDIKLEEDDITDALSEIIGSELPLDQIKIPKYKPKKKRVKKVATDSVLPTSESSISD